MSMRFLHVVLAEASARGDAAEATPGLEISVYYGNIQHALNDVEGFEWDEGNVRKSLDKHGVSAGEAEQVFFNDPLLLAEDAKHSDRERRMHALGKTSGGRLLQVTFTFRADGKLIRIISARQMHRKERLLYEQET